MGDGRFCGTYGRISLSLLDCRYRDLQYCAQRHGILFPEHVQRRSLRLDARGFPCTNQRYCLRACQLLGSSIQYSQSTDCSKTVGGKLKWSFVFGRSWSFCECACHHAGPSKEYGGAELLKYAGNYCLGLNSLEIIKDIPGYVHELANCGNDDRCVYEYVDDFHSS